MSRFRNILFIVVMVIGVASAGAYLYMNIILGYSEDTSQIEIYSLAVSPQYGADGSVFAAGREGGKSVEGSEIDVDESSGRFPRTIRSGSNRLVVNMDLIAVSPDFNHDQNVFVSGHIDVVYRSKDGGRTWEKFEIGRAAEINGIALSPDYAHDDTVFLGGKDCFYVSVDAGRSWACKHQGFGKGRVERIAISPDYVNDKTIFAGTYEGTDAGGLYASTDAGDNWFEVKGAGQSYVESIGISTGFESDGTLFVGRASGVYKTTDKGKTWARIDALDFAGGIALSPNYPIDKTVIIADDGLKKSTDGGRTWKTVKTDLTEVDVRDLAISPDYATDKTIIIGTESRLGSTKKESGVYRSTDDGKTWSPLFPI